MSVAIAEDLKPPTVTGADRDLPLVNATRNGDVAAFEELVRRYDRKLYSIAKGVTHNNEDAEEVVQTAFFKAYNKLHAFAGNARFSTWLIRIAINEAIMKLRKQRSYREQSLDSGPSFDHEGSNLALLERRFDVTVWAARPESLYSTIELREILNNSLQKLQPALRVVFILRDIEGHSVSETSEMLNLTPAAVKTRLCRARLHLREELSQYFKKRG